jgi:hypothetical protein
MVLNSIPGNGLVNRSAKFSSDLTLVIHIVPAAMASRTLCWAMELCFFLNVDIGEEEFVTTDLMSQKACVGPSSGTMAYVAYAKVTQSCLQLFVMPQTLSQI